MTIAPVDTGCCAICRRMECGIGWSPQSRTSLEDWPKRVKWVCEECAAEGLTSGIGKMSKTTLNKIEHESLMEAGEKAGALLDSEAFGCETDLAKLTNGQWVLFLEAVLEGYGNAMRKRVLEVSAPF